MREQLGQRLFGPADNAKAYLAAGVASGQDDVHRAQFVEFKQQLPGTCAKALCLRPLFECKRLLRYRVVG